MYNMLIQEETTHLGKAEVNVVIRAYILFHICFETVEVKLEKIPNNTSQSEKCLIYKLTHLRLSDILKN